MAEPPVLRHATGHGAHRAEAYQPIGEQLDAIAKGFRALIDGHPLPPETIAWVEACEAVKARFPKPTPNEGDSHAEDR